MMYERCDAPECPSDWAWIGSTAGHPAVWGIREAQLCDRHKLVHQLLAERWGLVVAYTPRWRVYAERSLPPW